MLHTGISAVTTMLGQLPECQHHFAKLRLSCIAHMSGCAIVIDFAAIGSFSVRSTARLGAPTGNKYLCNAGFVQTREGNSYHVCGRLRS